MWKFIDNAKTAGELYGRALVVIAAEQYASRLVVPTSQRAHPTPWASHKDLAAKVLRKLAGPHLSSSLKQLEQAIARANREYDAAVQQHSAKQRSEQTTGAAEDHVNAGGDPVEQDDDAVDDELELAHDDWEPGCGRPSARCLGGHGRRLPRVAGRGRHAEARTTPYTSPDFAGQAAAGETGPHQSRPPTRRAPTVRSAGGERARKRLESLRLARRRAARSERRAEPSPVSRARARDGSGSASHPAERTPKGDRPCPERESMS